jgi:dTDP-4-dehydrorhamnose reductase
LKNLLITGANGMVGTALKKITPDAIEMGLKNLCEWFIINYPNKIRGIK